MTIARIAAWSRSPLLSRRGLAGDRLVRARRLAERAQDLRRGRDRLMGPRERDQRVVDEGEVPPRLASADLDQHLGRGLVRVVAPEDLLEVGLHPAVAGRLGRRREQVRIRAAGRCPVDHGAQDPRRIVGRGACLGAHEVADVPARDEAADDEPEDPHRHREQQPDEPQGDRRHDGQREVAAWRDLQAGPAEQRSRPPRSAPRTPRAADPGARGPVAPAMAAAPSGRRTPRRRPPGPRSAPSLALDLEARQQPRRRPPRSVARRTGSRLIPARPRRGTRRRGDSCRRGRGRRPRSAGGRCAGPERRRRSTTTRSNTRAM